MPVPYKVTFNDDGNKCPRNIIELRNKPDCGVLFREEQPFKPDNRFPLPKGKIPIKDIGIIPGKFDVPKGIMPNEKAQMREDPRRLAYTTETLPQDENEIFMYRRLTEGNNMYERIPENVNTPLINENIPKISRTFTHQDADRVIQNLDDIMPIMRRDMLVDALEEPVLEQPRPIVRQSRVRVLPDPRQTEFTETKLAPRGMTDDQLIEEQIQQLKRTMPPDTHKEIKKVVEQELFPTTAISEEMEILKSIDKYVRKGRNEISQRELDTIIEDLTGRSISRERIMEVVDKYNAFDPSFEKAIGGIADSAERAFLRRMKAVRTIITEEPGLLSAEKQVSYGTFDEDTNLIPKEPVSTDTPLTESDTTRSRKFTISQEASYYARRARNLLPSQDYGDPQFEIAEDTMFERVKASEKVTTEFGRRLQLEALGVREKMVRGGKRLFAQEYKPVSLEEPISFEMSADAIKLRIPETNVNLEGLRDIPIDPFSETIGGRRTKLSFAERISAPRIAEIAEGSIHNVGGIGIAIGVSQLLDKAKVNKYANAAISGATGDVGGRIMSYGAKRVALRTGLRTAETSALTAKSLLRGGLEGGAIGLVAMPIDMVLNNSLRSAGLTHTASNMISTGIVGAGVTGAMWAGAASSAPETMGASLVVAALANGALELMAFLSGQSADKQVEKINNTNKVRSEFIDTLPQYNYNYRKALNAFVNAGKSGGLGMNTSDWKDFEKSLDETFTLNPVAVSKSSRKTSSGFSVEDQALIQSYFSKYILHNLIKKVCSGGKECSPDLVKQDKGELDENEVKFLNDKTDFTWQSRADTQVNVSIKQMEFTQKRVQFAKEQIISNWENNKRLPEQLADKDILKIANIDPNFRKAFDNAVKLESQKAVVDAYYKDQTKMENLPENIQKMANLDKDFYYHIHVFYEDTEKQAGKMNLSVPQLIELQGLPQEQQNNKYREFQFDYAKMNEKTIIEAQSLYKEENVVREAGYYDIDQAYLVTDPTAVGIWKPTDSQILQAHSAGMTLQMYVDYMGELSKGEQGDFSKLPKYTEEQIKSSGILDFSHFEDELQMAGFDETMYSYDPETLSITLNPNVSSVPIPSTENKFISKYTPENVLKMRQETADLIHGLDQQNQNIVDTYNAELKKQLSVFGENYNKQVASINDQRSYHGINNLLIYDENTAYQKQHLEFKPVEILPTVATTKPFNSRDPENVGNVSVNKMPNKNNLDNRPQRDTTLPEDFNLLTDG
jgi:hypothetical protein